jgi:hypothetical protein
VDSHLPQGLDLNARGPLWDSNRLKLGGGQVYDRSSD